MTEQFSCPRNGGHLSTSQQNYWPCSVPMAAGLCVTSGLGRTGKGAVPTVARSEKCAQMPTRPDLWLSCWRAPVDTCLLESKSNWKMRLRGSIGNWQIRTPTDHGTTGMTVRTRNRRSSGTTSIRTPDTCGRFWRRPHIANRLRPGNQTSAATIIGNRPTVLVAPDDAGDRSILRQFDTRRMGQSKNLISPM